LRFMRVMVTALWQDSDLLWYESDLK